MSKKVFISYSNSDINRLRILEKELKKIPNIIPLIIADKRQALIPLTKKVVEGIKEADYFVPILTSNSFTNQWVNQEIGYATALNKTTRPIVENEIIDKLKGFVHKQIDLPYIFASDSKNKFRDSSNFSVCCKKLAKDIQLLYASDNSQPKQEIVNIVGGKNTLDIIKPQDIKKNSPIIEIGIQKGNALIRKFKKKQYLETEKALTDANNEVEHLYNEFKKIVDSINGKTEQKVFIFEHEQKIDNRIIIYGGDHSLLVRWTTFYVNSLNGSELNICLFKGYMSLANISNTINKLKPIVKDINYHFDIADDGKTRGWNNETNVFYASKDFADNWFKSLLNYFEKQ